MRQQNKTEIHKQAAIKNQNMPWLVLTIFTQQNSSLFHAATVHPLYSDIQYNYK